MNNFYSHFTQYSLPILENGVKLPDFKIEDKYKLKYSLSHDCSDYQFLLKLCREGLEKKIGKNHPKIKEYETRTDNELQVFKELGFCSYILITWDIVNYCIENKIATGFGRGSAGNCLVLYLVDVTQIDPIASGDLYFERFLNKTRAKFKEIDGVKYYDGSLLCDVDLDISFSDRARLVDWLNEKYKGRIAKLPTTGTYTTKVLLKEVSKAYLEVGEEYAAHISSMIPVEYGKPKEIDDAIEMSEDFKKFTLEHPEVIEISKNLYGLNKYNGVHASAWVITADDINEIFPLRLTKDGEICSVYTMEDSLNLAIKVDILGLRCATLIDKVCKMVQIDPLKIKTDDEKVYTFLQNLESPKGLFQVEADCNYRVLKQVKPKKLAHIAAIVALARPGVLQFVEVFAKYVDTGEFQSVHPFFDDILQDTAGIPLYQESLLKMANKVGFTLSESETLRRCVTNDTMFVSKTRGWITIKKLLQDGYKNDLFLVASRDGQKTWKPIKDIWSNGIHQVTHVQTSNGLEIKATQYHQFLTDTGWKARRRLVEKKDYLVGIKSIDYDGKDSISINLAYIIMGVVCEGYFTCNQSTFTAWDKEIMHEFCERYEAEFNKKIKLDKLGRVAYIKQEERLLINKYLNYGKSASKSLPECLMGMTKEVTRKLLALFFSYEGSVVNQKNKLGFEGCSASKLLIQQIQLLLLRFGIYSNVYQKFNKKYRKYYYHLDISQFTETTKFRNEILPLICQEKRELFLSLYREKVVTNTFDVIPNTIITKLLNQYPSIANDTGGASGRLYKNPIGRTKFKQLSYETNDKEWINLSEGEQCYLLFDNQKDDTREVETFDFTIDEETPYIVANGLIIHNCIGKKKVEEMAEWEQKVKDKIKENKLPLEVGDILWKIMDDSKNYSFNAGHASAYGLMSYVTAYLKYHYPKEFFLCLLELSKDEPNTTQEIQIIQAEMKNFGIKLLGPDLIKSGIDFNIDKDNIRFGLGYIKGIAQKSFEKLQNFKHDFPNKFEIFLSAQECGINIGVLSSLIMSGAMNEYITESRSKSVLECQTWRLLTQREKEKCLEHAEEYNYKLFDVIKYLKTVKDEKGKPFFKESRLETIRKKFKKYEAIYNQNRKYESLCEHFYEKKLLGYSYSHKLDDILRESYPRLISIEEAKQCTVGETVVVCGEIEEVDILISKKKQKYCKLIINDGSSSYPCLIFNHEGVDNIGEMELENEGKFEEGWIVVVKGNKKSDSIFCSTVSRQEIKIYSKLSEIKDEKKLDKIENIS
jgi:DNA polymerase III subunit alpha